MTIGSLFAPLYRGAFVGIEDLVYTPADGDCTKTRATVWVDWDSAANLGFPATKVSRFAAYRVTMIRSSGQKRLCSQEKSQSKKEKAKWLFKVIGNGANCAKVCVSPYPAERPAPATLVGMANMISRVVGTIFCSTTI